MSERVQIYHPKIPGTRTTPETVSRHQYEVVWKAKGWRLHPPRTRKAAEVKEIDS